MAAGPAPELRPLMDERTFRDNFSHLVFSHVTYLCHYVERLEGDSWIPVDEFKGFLRNQGSYRGHRGRHAEPIFRERMASWRLDEGLRYRVTCYISWSPCQNCANELAAFLRENTHVDLRIFAARIYEYLRGYEFGLRKLRAAGAEVAMMTSDEFEHCWESFVDHQGRSFLPWDNLNAQSEKLSRRLEGILQMRTPSSLQPLFLCPPPLFSLGHSFPLFSASPCSPAPSWGPSCSPPFPPHRASVLPHPRVFLPPALSFPLSPNFFPVHLSNTLLGSSPYPPYLIFPFAVRVGPAAQRGLSPQGRALPRGRAPEKERKWV